MELTALPGDVFSAFRAGGCLNASPLTLLSDNEG